MQPNAEPSRRGMRPRNVVSAGAATARRQAAGPDGRGGRLVYWAVTSGSEAYTFLLALSHGLEADALISAVRFTGKDTSAPTDAWKIRRTADRLEIIPFPDHGSVHRSTFEPILAAIVTEEWLHTP